MLDYEILNVLFIYVLHNQSVSAVEFALHPHRVHHRGYAVQTAGSIFCVKATERRNGADCPGNRLRLAYSAGFYYNVVELAGSCEFEKLLNQICLESAADATVLKSHKTLVLLAHNSAFLDEVRVYVYLTYVIYYHCETYAFAIVQNPV